MAYTILTGAKTVSGSIRDWVNHSAVPATSILTEAQAWIYQRIRVRQMQTEVAFAVAAAASSFALPAGFLDPIVLKIDGHGDGLDYIHEDIFQDQYRFRDDDGDLYEGFPSAWSILGENVLFDVALTEALAGDLYYYGIPAALSGANETNFLTTRFPTLLRYACMAYAFDYRKRAQERDAHFILAERAILDLEIGADRVRRGQLM